MSILITGANGQLGQCFRQLAQQYPQLSCLFAGSSELDISDAQAVRRYFQDHPDITWVFNCAAYTAVDKAESAPQQAKAVNETGVKNLARACRDARARLIHLSTDYVYHSSRNLPFTESDKVSPKSVYARTKRAGERVALRTLPDAAMIIRTSWVYAAHGQNFVRTMLRLGAERPALNVVYDQIGTPTYAPDLAEAMFKIVQMIENQSVDAKYFAGIWHYSNEGVTSWYDFAHAIFEIKKLPCKVHPIPTSAYPTPAKRPPFSVMSKDKIKSVFGLHIPHWRESLEICLSKL